MGPAIPGLTGPGSGRRGARGEIEAWTGLGPPRNEEGRFPQSERTRGPSLGLVGGPFRPAGCEALGGYRAGSRARPQELDRATAPGRHSATVGRSAGGGRRPAGEDAGRGGRARHRVAPGVALREVQPPAVPLEAWPAHPTLLASPSLSLVGRRPARGGPADADLPRLYR